MHLVLYSIALQYEVTRSVWTKILIRRPVTIPHLQNLPPWNTLTKCTKHLPDPGPVKHRNVSVITPLLANNTQSPSQNVSSFSFLPDSCPVRLRESPVIRPVKPTWCDTHISSHITYYIHFTYVGMPYAVCTLEYCTMQPNLPVLVDCTSTVLLR